MVLLLLLSLFLCAPFLSAAQTTPDPDQQIAAAVKAAPEALRDGATVLGYRSGSTLEVLREGTNPLICLADEPNDGRFHVACYHRSLEPFMARGRELRNRGMNPKEAKEKREVEARSGELSMPKEPATLYFISGKDKHYNYDTGELTGGMRMYVIYTPYATVESTGFPLKPAVKGGPWLMREGEPSAHIMIPLPSVE